MKILFGSVIPTYNLTSITWKLNENVRSHLFDKMFRIKTIACEIFFSDQFKIKRDLP